MGLTMKDLILLTGFSGTGKSRVGQAVARMLAWSFVDIDDEIARLLADGVTAAEVERIKRRMIAETTYARDSLYRAARAFGSALTSGLTVEDVEAWPDRIAAVTAEQVNAAARAVLRPETSVTGVLLPEEAG